MATPLPSRSASKHSSDSIQSSEPPAAAAAVPNPQTRSQRWKAKALTFLSDQHFLLAMVIMIPISSQYHLPLPVQEKKSEVVFYTCISLIFLITGCTLDSSVLARNYKRWKTHIYVLVQCFLVCSALVLGIVSAAGTNRDLDPGTLIGFLVLGCLPTTISSNVVMTAQANGNQELTLVETTISNFLGVFISPALVVLYTSTPTWYNSMLPRGASESFLPIYRRVLKQLGLSIYVPLLTGQLLRHYFKPHCDTLFKHYNLSKLGSVAILVILWSTYDQAFASGAFTNLSTPSILFLVLTLIGVWMAWFCLGFGVSVLARYGRRDVIALTFCVAAKGPAIGVPLVDRIWDSLALEGKSRVQVPIAIYQSMQIAFGGLMVGALRSWVEGEVRGKGDEEERVGSEEGEGEEKEEEEEEEGVGEMREGNKRW